MTIKKVYSPAQKGVEFPEIIQAETSKQTMPALSTRPARTNNGTSLGSTSIVAIEIKKTNLELSIQPFNNIGETGLGFGLQKFTTMQSGEEFGKYMYQVNVIPILKTWEEIKSTTVDLFYTEWTQLLNDDYSLNNEINANHRRKENDRRQAAIKSFDEVVDKDEQQFRPADGKGGPGYKRLSENEKKSETKPVPQELQPTRVFQMLMESGVDLQKQWFIPFLHYSSIDDQGTAASIYLDEIITATSKYDYYRIMSRIESIKIPLMSDETFKLSTGRYDIEVKKHKLRYEHKSSFTYRAERDLAGIAVFKQLAALGLNQSKGLTLTVYSGNGYGGYFDGEWQFHDVKIISCDDISFKPSPSIQVFNIGFTFSELTYSPYDKNINRKSFTF